LDFVIKLAIDLIRVFLLIAIAILNGLWKRIALGAFPQTPKSTNHLELTCC